MNKCKKVLASMLVLMFCMVCLPVQTADAATGISKKSATLYVGQSTTLKVTGVKGKVTWSTSNKSVATVTSKGVVKAKKSGKATITAKVGKKKYSSKITVKNIALNKTSLNVYVGTSYQLKLNGNSKKIAWSSSNKAVATVDSKGKVTAKKDGKAVITAKVGTKKYTCKVTVKYAQLTSQTFKMNIGDKYHFYIRGYSGKVTWSTSNTSILTVNSKGDTVAKKAGNVYLYAKTSKGTYRAKVAVSKVPVTKVTLYTTSHTMENKSTYQLDAYVSPYNATIKKVTWSSSNTKVATVSSTGLVTSKAPGTATITASCDGKKATCKITVKDTFDATEATKYIVLDEFETTTGFACLASNNYRKSVALTVKITYYDANGKEISNDSDTIYGIAPGSGYIFAFSKPEKGFATYKLTRTVRESSCKVFANDKIDVNVTSATEDGLEMTVTNNSGKKLSYIEVCVMYGYGDEIVMVRNYSVSCNDVGSKDTLSVMQPYGFDYKDLPFDSYAVIVNAAYSY